MVSVFLFIGGPEIFVVILIVVLFFGADKIPEIARGLGKGIRQAKEATNDIKKEIRDSSKVQSPQKELSNNIEQEISDVKSQLDEVEGAVKRDS